MTNLGVTFAGLNFKNPVIAASATPTKNEEFMRKCIDANCGGFIAKTPSWDEMERIYPCPRFYVFYPEAVKAGKLFSFYTNEQLAEYTPEEFAELLGNVMPYAKEKNCRVIASIMGGNDDEWARMAALFDPVCEAVELNLACPYGGELAGKKGAQVGADPDLVEGIIKIVRANTNKPIIAKLPAEGGDLTAVIIRLNELKVDAITTTHRFSGLEIDIETGKPIMNGAISGYGGPWAAPISRKWVAKAAQLTDIDICGGGGVDGWRDSVAHIMAGAKTVQMCGGPTLRGYEFFKETVEGIAKFMERKEYDSIDAMVGKSVPFVKHIRQVPRKDVFMAKGEVIEDKCTGCGYCKKVCFYNAITIENKKSHIDKDKCDGCGMCMQMCSTGALVLKHDGTVVPTSWEGARGRIGEASRK